MKKRSFYIAALFYGLAPTIASAHAQFTTHHHEDSGYWLSLIPEILLVVSFVAAVLLAMRHIRKVRSALNKWKVL